MKKFYALVILLCGITFTTIGQVSISTDNGGPDPSAMLDVKSTVRGFLPPRMTFEQRNAIVNPVEGLLVYCTNCTQNGSSALSIYQNGIWGTTLIVCNEPLPPTTGVHDPAVNQITWNWNSVPIAKGYKWNTTGNYTGALDVGLTNSYTETGLTCWTTYHRYVWAYNDCGNAEYLWITQATSMSPFSGTPTQGTHIPSNNQIIWNWNQVAGALGYKWGTTNNITLSTDLSTNLSMTETGLTCANNYTRYVWAYDACGYSEALALNASTIACYFCNETLSINHIQANGVAPVNKLVSYSMIANIPGETGKCWITKNLGANQQATAVNDATEGSAGWYWQFNRKKGYKHDGSILTPSWTITSISEYFDWQTVNDPCKLELGTQWRLPTYTEWFNVDNVGGWSNWNGPWNSGLKLHAAGDISVNGSLEYRGSEGYYWSGTQLSSSYGQGLNFFSLGSGTGFYASKAMGFTARCLREL
jgi:hypothetical protein